MGKIKTGIKMKVNPEQSRKIQEICFENDIEWGSGTHLKHFDKPFLYIDDSYLLGYGNIIEERYFNTDKSKEVSAELFIRTNGTCVESETLTEDNNKGEQMEEYHSISEAGRKNNLEKANISKICNNYKTKKYKTKYQTCGGFKWKFKD